MRRRNTAARTPTYRFVGRHWMTTSCDEAESVLDSPLVNRGVPLEGYVGPPRICGNVGVRSSDPPRRSESRCPSHVPLRTGNTVKKRRG